MNEIIFLILLFYITVFICSFGYLVTAILEASKHAEAEEWGRWKARWGLALAVLVFGGGITVILMQISGVLD